jgi:hypothetical protein
LRKRESTRPPSESVEISSVNLDSAVTCIKCVVWSSDSTPTSPDDSVGIRGDTCGEKPPDTAARTRRAPRQRVETQQCFVHGLRRKGRPAQKSRRIARPAHLSFTRCGGRTSVGIRGEWRGHVHLALEGREADDCAHLTSNKSSPAVLSRPGRSRLLPYFYTKHSRPTSNSVESPT